MNQISVMALFCEDIRDEKSGQVSLVGIMSDNANVPHPPKGTPTIGMIPKLAIYLRASFDVNAEIDEIKFVMELPDGEKVAVGSANAATIAEAKGTKAKGNPMGTIISTVKIQPLPLAKLGRITVRAYIGKQEYLAGFLNVISEGAAA